jgi:hypothetical protein
MLINIHLIMYVFWGQWRFFMNNKCFFYLVLVLGSVASGDYAGNYQYAAFNLLYHNGTLPYMGETKTLSPEFNDLTFSMGGAFDADLDIKELSRNITNVWQSGAGDQVGTGYSFDEEFIYDSIAGQVEPLPFNVLLVTPDEEDAGLPFIFNTTTNVALTLTHEAQDSSSETGLGVLVAHSSGKSDSSLNGRYAWFALSSAFREKGGVDSIVLKTATATFDGNGSYTESGYESIAERSVKETVVDLGGDTVVDTVFVLTNNASQAYTQTGTYAVDDNGRVSLMPLQGRPFDAQISPDDNLAVSSGGYITFQPGGEPGLGGGLGGTETLGGGAVLDVLIRIPDSYPTQAVDSVYFLGEFGEAFRAGQAGASFADVSVARSYLFLRADQTFSLRSDDWLTENRFENDRFDDGDGTTNMVSANHVETETFDKSVWLSGGTYAVETNGVLSLMFANGETFEAQLSTNGEYLVYAGFDHSANEAETRLGIGFRRTPPESVGTAVIDHLALTPIGAELTVSMPTNLVVEAIASTNLTSGVWESGGLISTTTGTLEIIDSDATHAVSRFYSTTFEPW